MLDLVLYSEESPSGLIWKESRGSAAVGDCAGSFDSSSGYWRVGRRPRLLAHRIVWELHNGLIDGNLVVDHIDGDKLNNKISNLRVVENKLNTRNAVKYSNNTSGKTGVSYNKPVAKKNISGRWVATWYDEFGKLRTKSFSTEKYGEDRAKFLAIDFRNRQIELLNLNGAGYTERHGT